MTAVSRLMLVPDAWTRDATSAENDRVQRLERENEALRSEVERLTRFRDLAYRDHLTHTFNRRYLEEKALDYLEGVEPDPCVSLVVLDVDDFKTINDRFGHDTGDRVLCAVGHVLRREARRNDAVGRWGGDEFYALLPGSSADGTRAFVDRLEIALRATVVESRGGATVRLACSLGYALAPEDGHTFSDLFERADDRLYHSKRRCSVRPGRSRTPDA
ncbi:MAG: GGDEF domain-containing protein [Myxococcales bacterium]|nr:GGDEF domain-containing protein [Myxococcales bacterium]